ncbi:uncharacterized protein LOC144612823 [Panthera onca]
MGQSQSTPVSLLVANFRDVRTRGQNLSLDIRRGKLITLCRSEWPTFGVGWPTEGTFCLPIIAKVKSKIFLPGREGRPDQIPYILVWRNLVENPPPLLAPFLSSGTCKVLAMWPADPLKSRTPAAPLYPILPDREPGGREAAAAPEPGGQEAAAVLGPIENETNLEGPAGRTRGRTQREPNPRLPDSTVALPLWEIGPPDETGNPRLQYWPFSTSDLYNWKTQNARFSDNPKDLIALLDSVMFTHQPTWDDCQQLLRILFTTEERERIQLEARKLVPGDDGRPTSNPDLINAAFPLTRPPQDEWDYNTEEAAETPEACIQGTEGLLRTLGTLGYRASAKKAQICKSEGLLLNPLRVIFTPPTALNPASLLPDPDMGTPLHDCADILAQVYGVREDLQDQPLSDTDAIWFTDGSSFVHQGQRYAGAAVTSETEVVWAENSTPRNLSPEGRANSLNPGPKVRKRPQANRVH